MKRNFSIIVGTILFMLAATSAFAEDVTLSMGLKNAAEPEQISTSIKILVLMTVISIGPAILLMTTSFTRIVVVLSFLRQAMATQAMPPNQIIVGLSLFLTFFIMAPTWEKMNAEALQPYINGAISQEQAIDKGIEPMRTFMLKQTDENDLMLMIELSGSGVVEKPENVPTVALIPAFMISELKRAFEISFLIYIPFLIIDMVVASILMAMGMMMLPPPIISLPFKLLLFVMVDGWHLIADALVRSFVV